jgi:hypothetical protein
MTSVAAEIWGVGSVQLGRDRMWGGVVLCGLERCCCCKTRMDAHEKALARILFRNKVYASDGQVFENLFTAVMVKVYPDFVQVKPQGAIGDKKNDGYSKSKGLFFQVFAPENLELSEAEAVKKAKLDFSGLKDYWNVFCPVKQFFFVMNDKYKGTFPTIEADLAEIKTTHSLEGCGTFLAKDLEDALLGLKDDEIISIVGFIPHPDRLSQLDYSVMNEVIGHIMAHKGQVTSAQVLSAPDFDEKIQFNGLGREVAAMLTSGSFHAGLVDNYFSLNSNFAKQEVRDLLNQMYESALAKDAGKVGHGVNKSDLVFFDLMGAVVPNKTEAAQDAAVVLMAHFFESCDIFEDPQAVGAK